MATAKKPAPKQAETVKTAADLQKELAEKQNDLLQAQQSHKAGELANPRVLRSLRRDIARILTALSATNTKETK